MTKRIRAKYKIDRRIGQKLWGRAKSPLNKREKRPGQHGERRTGKLSDYGQQLQAKQKLKRYYANIGERQFRGIYEEARRFKGSTSEHLIGLLERRLMHRLSRNFVPTPFARGSSSATGHVTVNGGRVNIPGFRCKIGDLVEVKEKGKQRPCCSRRSRAPSATSRLHRVDHSKMTAKLVRVPGSQRSAFPVAHGTQPGGRVLQQIAALILGHARAVAARLSAARAYR